jgi:hypothetical protein
MPRLLVLIGLLFSTSIGGLAAQVPFEACLDRHEHLIPGIVDNSIGWAAVATYRDGGPVIVWNAKEDERIPRVEQLFIYLHECAHHTLGHLWKEVGPKSELEADCWAIQLMVDGGMIKGGHLEELERSRRHVQGDATHLGGEEHIRSLQWCLDIRTDRKAWATALDAFVSASADSFVTSRGRVVDSTETGHLYESLLDAPGTYDCEIVGPAVRCMVFAARKPGAAKGRFEELEKIIHNWLPPGWTAIDEATPPAGITRRYLAEDGSTGTLVALMLTQDARVFLVVRRTAVH